MANTAEMMSGYRVLDLTNENGYLCGKILGDMGADVIKIENPRGDSGRKIGPFYRQVPDIEKSLYWFAYNLNKRGITLDIETEDGRQILSRLIKKADFIIESYPTGYLDKLGLSYAKIHEINPRIVMTSITPFGRTGPYKDYKGSDLVVMAMSGLMYITGDPDTAPLRISFPQAFLLASAHAAAASMIAHYYRETGGQGQHVDVSAQECALWEIANGIPLWQVNKILYKRAGSFLSGRWSDTKQRLLWRCKDGFVSFYILGGPSGIKTNQAITKWMAEKGEIPDYLKTYDWRTLDMLKQTQEMQDRLEKPIGEFFLRYTKAELYLESFKRGIMLYPVCNAKDIRENEQLKARNYWVNIEHSELGTTITYPGAFAKLSETPLTFKKRAPLIGEHNPEIYEQELGLSKSELAVLHQSGVI
jgi:crotonobetainyl-CoA:carnitine CoA-transferase CaiB-like acyl-CoA transferase